jgi:membrane associated rhomboid family serine protease
MIPIRDTIPSTRFPAVTIGLICLNAIVFIVEINLSARGLETLFLHWGIVPLRFTHPRLDANYLTFISSMFLHGGWMHIIGNMWSLWIFGDNVEDRMGRMGFLAFYILSGLAAGVGHVVTNPVSPVPTVGASGAIAGVMGAYLLLFPHARVVTIIPIFIFFQIVEVPAVIFLGIWFVIQLFSGTVSLATAGANAGGVAWWAHIGGFMVGVFWALPLRRRNRSLLSDRRQRFYRYYDDDDHWG